MESVDDDLQVVQLENIETEIINEFHDNDSNELITSVDINDVEDIQLKRKLEEKYVFISYDLYFYNCL